MQAMFDPTELGTEALRPIKRAEYDRMVELGIIDEDEHVELLRGWLVRMSPAKPRHGAVLATLNELLLPPLLGRARVYIQSALALSDDSEPEPDLALVAPTPHLQEHPSTASLVVEVSNSSLKRDRRVKGRLYAESGIPEYWIVNLAEECIEVHREPSPGGYQRLERFTEGVIRLAVFPDLSVDVRKVLRAG